MKFEFVPATNATADQGGPESQRRLWPTSCQAPCATASLLKSAGLYENTAIFFLSENGCHLGNHGSGKKLAMHEESVRVPMFVHYPGQASSGMNCPELVSSLDVLRPILELADVQPPESMMGTLFVLLFDEPDHPLWEFVDSESVGLGGKIGQGHRMVRINQWKYMLTDVNEESLFHQHTDPFELMNLASDPDHHSTLVSMRSECPHGWIQSEIHTNGQADV